VILTTSRKPGRKTRTLSRVLSAYMNWDYISRGKRGMEELMQLAPKIAVIEEIKGNPAVLKVYDGGKEVFLMRFNPGIIKKEKMDSSPVFFSGKLWFDPEILDAVPAGNAGNRLKKRMRLRNAIRKEVVAGRKEGREYLNFLYDGSTVILLYPRR
jgi:U3 small nucleolar ribonucleoprotein protein IMP4